MSSRNYNDLLLILAVSVLLFLLFLPVYFDGVCIAAGENREAMGVCFRNWLQAIGSMGSLAIAAAAALVTQYWMRKQYISGVSGLRADLIKEIEIEIDVTRKATVLYNLIYQICSSNDLSLKGNDAARLLLLSSKSFIDQIDEEFKNYRRHFTSRRTKELRKKFINRTSAVFIPMHIMRSFFDTYASSPQSVTIDFAQIENSLNFSIVKFKESTDEYRSHLTSMMDRIVSNDDILKI